VVWEALALKVFEFGRGKMSVADAFLCTVKSQILAGGNDFGYFYAVLSG